MHIGPHTMHIGPHKMHKGPNTMHFAWHPRYFCAIGQFCNASELEKRMLLSQMLNQTNISHNCKFRILAQTMKTYTECISR